MFTFHLAVILLLSLVVSLTCTVGKEVDEKIEVSKKQHWTSNFQPHLLKTSIGSERISE